MTIKPKWAMDLCDVICLGLMNLRITHNFENYERISYIRLLWNRIGWAPAFGSLEAQTTDSFALIEEEIHSALASIIKHL